MSPSSIRVNEVVDQPDATNDGDRDVEGTHDCTEFFLWCAEDKPSIGHSPALNRRTPIR
jgi:hypothetical protein